MKSPHSPTQTATSNSAPQWAVQRAEYRQADYHSVLSDKRLLADPQLCLNAVLHDFGCNACQSQCPAGAIQFNSKGLPEVAKDCTDCGQCAVACPTASFQHPSFTLPELNAFDVSKPLQIVCQREQKQIPARNQWRVPCIGGVKASQFLKSVRSFPSVEILDKGHCSGCASAAQVTNKADIVNHQAWWYLQELGLSERLQIKSQFDPDAELNSAQATNSISPEGEKVSRRGLFQNLLKRTDDKPSPQSKNKVSYHTLYRLKPLERQQQLFELKQLDIENTVALTRFLPSIVVKDDCCDHQVCRSSCPTGAIFGYEREGARGLVFDASICVFCGLCEQVCPEQQLHFFGANGGQQTKALTRHERRSCFECGHEFSRNQLDETALPVCPSCDKDKQLFNSLWG